MNAVAEKMPKPIREPRATSESGRNRYRPTLVEHERIVDKFAQELYDSWAKLNEARTKAQRATRTLWLLGPVLFVGGVAAGVVFW